MILASREVIFPTCFSCDQSNDTFSEAELRLQETSKIKLLHAGHSQSTYMWSMWLYLRNNSLD